VPTVVRQASTAGYRMGGPLLLVLIPCCATIATR
jgi:hypothetical protein